jgi:3'(2'), 5'-bisphosphate nucleotidase
MDLEHSTRMVCDIAVEAGQAILDVYQDGDLELVLKDDASPLTRADIASHEIIEKSLISAFPGFPLLSEESVEVAWEGRKHWTRYWLIDPLDGSREFIRRNGEFTVNIALVEKGVPVVGVVFAPVFDGFTGVTIPVLGAGTEPKCNGRSKWLMIRGRGNHCGSWPVVRMDQKN